MKVKILIVEDELIIAEDMRMMLEDLGYDVVGIAMDYKEACDLLEEEDPDIVLSDIALGGEKDGVDVAKLIKARYNLPFIFVTSHSDSATLDRAKTMNPNGYLVKPFESKDLYTSIEVALANYSLSNSSGQKESDSDAGMLVKDSIYVKEGHMFIKIKLNELQWIKADGNYLELHTKAKRHVIRNSMRDFLEKLPDASFTRVHKSYVVNTDAIEAINNAEVHIGKEIIPLGRNFRDELLKKVNTV